MTASHAARRRPPAHAVVARAPLDVAVSFLRGTFAPADRLAVVLVRRPTGAVTQRLATADTLTTTNWQAWLRAMNAQQHDVFVSINALTPGARQRTKRDIGCVRHLFLDVDHDADGTLARLRRAPGLPPPHHVVRSSRGRCQVLWRVSGLSPAAAEQHQRSLAVHFGGDLAATDCARVGRWPGFRNYKYADRPFVTVVTRLAPPCDAAAFAPFVTPCRAAPPHRAASSATRTAPTRPSGSQSERDWQATVRHLAAGVPIADVERGLAVRRRDKHQPTDYAARTVDAAWATLALRAGRSPDALIVELRARRYTHASPSTYAAAIVARAVTRAHQSSPTVQG